MNSRSPQKAKLLLIPVLGIVLVYIVFQGDESDDLETLASHASSARSSKDDRKADETQQTLKPLPPWPSFALDAMIAHNPFHIPQPPPAQCELQKKADELSQKPVVSHADEIQKLRVSAVVSGRDGMIALVNNQMVRVGDTLAGGLVVLGIDENAITVKRVTP